MYPLLLLFRFSGLLVHKKNKHSGKQFPCLECPRVYQTICGLGQHRRYKHGKGNITMLPCCTCGKLFLGQRLLKAHEQSHNTKDFDCSRCPSAFKTLSQLKQHLKRHDKAYTHTCKLCNKKFYTLQNLRDHEHTHSGEKPYACQLCDFRCAFGGNLKKHMRVHLKALI